MQNYVAVRKRTFALGGRGQEAEMISAQSLRVRAVDVCVRHDLIEEKATRILCARGRIGRVVEGVDPLFILPDSMSLHLLVSVLELLKCSDLMIIQSALDAALDMMNKRSIKRLRSLWELPETNRSVLYCNDEFHPSVAEHTRQFTELCKARGVSACRADRLVIGAAQYLASTGIRVLVISFRKPFLQLCKGILCDSWKNFLEENAPDLVEELDSVVPQSDGSATTVNTLASTADSGHLFNGRLRCSSGGDEAFLVQPGNKFVVASNKAGSIRALHGDTVVARAADTAGQCVLVQVVDKGRCWEESFPATPIAGTGDGEWITCVPLDRRLPLMRVRVAAGVSAINGQRVLLRIMRWRHGEVHPRATLVQVMGPIGDLETEASVIVTRFGLSSTFFDTAVWEEAVKANGGMGWTAVGREETVLPDIISPLPVVHDSDPRVDLTEQCIFSIDPPGCRDVDDALSIESLPGGFVLVGIHIADVDAWLPRGSVMDKEARKRGTTVYLVDRRFSMIPEPLSSDIASLRCGVDRLAVSLYLKISESGEIVSSWAHRSRLNLVAQLSYEDAQRVLEGGCLAVGTTPPKSLTNPPVLSQGCTVRYTKAGGLVRENADLRETQEAISMLHSCATKLRSLRMSGGGLDLAGAEPSFTLDDTGQPVSSSQGFESAASQTVAEFMITANVAVAKILCKFSPGEALVRNHPPPSSESCQELLEAGIQLGVELDCSSNRSLSKSLATAAQAAQSHGDVARSRLLQLWCVRAMRQAEYSLASTVSTGSTYHYGLGVDVYTHFTSPIRRYADLEVHRQLLEAIRCGACGEVQSDRSVRENSTEVGMEALEMLCEHLNEKNAAAKRASADSIELFLALLYKSSPAEEEAIVEPLQRVLVDSIRVMLPRFSTLHKILLNEPVTCTGVAKLEVSEDRVNVIGEDGETVGALSRGSSVVVALSCQEVGTQLPRVKVKLASCGLFDAKAESVLFSRRSQESTRVAVREAAGATLAHGPRGQKVDGTGWRDEYCWEWKEDSDAKIGTVRKVRKGQRAEGVHRVWMSGRVAQRLYC